MRRRSDEKVVSTSGDLFSSSSLSRRRKSETNASSSSSSPSSLVPETLREMESDPEFQQTRLKLEKFGQKTLTREESAKRRRALENFGVSESFAKFIEKEGGKALDREAPPSIVQVNIGIYCNQACSHCHVESSPLRKEETMSRETRERVERILEKSEGVTTLDITGGAPELAPELAQPPARLHPPTRLRPPADFFPTARRLPPARLLLQVRRTDRRRSPSVAGPHR